MRISLLDPGLISLSGHHLDWDLRIVDELTSLGHRVEVFASNRVKPKVVALFSGRARLSPLFRFYPYTDPGEIDPIAGEVSVFLDGAALLVEDLRRIDECDLWFWPSLFAPQLHACSLVGRAPKIAGCIHIAPGFGAVTGAMWWRYAFLSAKRINLRANIGVTGPLLQKAYASLTASGQIECLPVPYDGAPTGVRKTRLTRIGFFGYQRRWSKGAALVPELVSRLLRDGFQVVLHGTTDFVRVENAPGLTILGYVRCLAEEIAKCDLVIVPYDPAEYRLMGSGIVWDAIASGVPVIVPSDTGPGLLIEETAAGKTISVVSIEEICRAINDVQQNYEQISIAAFEASRRWRTTQGVTPFVAAMLSGRQAGQASGNVCRDITPSISTADDRSAAERSHAPSGQGPLITIGIPTYSRSRSLRRSLESALSQDYGNIEVLVSDNASTDETESLCRELCAQDARLRYIRQPTNRGSHPNFAEVLAQAHGEYFMWLSDDDWLDSNYVSECADFLVRHPDYSLVCGKDNYFRGDKFDFGEPIVNLPQVSPKERVVSYFRRVCRNGMLYGLMRRKLLLTLTFPPVLGGDWLLMSQVAFLGKTKTLETVSINRSAGGESGDMERHSLRMGLSPRQAKNPHVVIARSVFRDIAWGSPTYRSLGRLVRLQLAMRSFWGIFSGFCLPYYRSRLNDLLARPCRRFLDRHVTWRFRQRW